MKIFWPALFIFMVILCSSAVSAEVPAERRGLQQQEELASSVARLKDSLRKDDSADSNVIKDSMRAREQEGNAAPQQEGSMAMTMFKGLGLCLGLFLVGVSIAKRINPRLRHVNRDRMAIISRVPLTNKTQLMLVDIDGKEVLLAVGQDRVAFLDRSPVQAPVCDNSEAAPSSRLANGKELQCEEFLQRIA